MSSEVNLSEVSEQCMNYTGADLQALVYNAQLEAIHEVIDRQDNSSPTDDDSRVSDNPPALTAEHQHF